jgi:hypothetical protein
LINSNTERILSVTLFLLIRVFHHTRGIQVEAFFADTVVQPYM